MIWCLVREGWDLVPGFSGGGFRVWTGIGDSGEVSHGSDKKESELSGAPSRAAWLTPATFCEPAVFLSASPQGTLFDPAGETFKIRISLEQLGLPGGAPPPAHELGEVDREVKLSSIKWVIEGGMEIQLLSETRRATFPTKSRSSEEDKALKAWR